MDVHIHAPDPEAGLLQEEDLSAEAWHSVGSLCFLEFLFWLCQLNQFVCFVGFFAFDPSAEVVLRYVDRHNLVTHSLKSWRTQEDVPESPHARGRANGGPNTLRQPLMDDVHVRTSIASSSLELPWLMLNDLGCFWSRGRLPGWEGQENYIATWTAQES